MLIRFRQSIAESFLILLYHKITFGSRPLQPHYVARAAVNMTAIRFHS